MDNIFRIGKLSTHWQYIITTVITFRYDVWSGKYWDKATSDFYCIHFIHFCTKTEPAMADWRDEVTKRILILIHYTGLCKVTL